MSQNSEEADSDPSFNGGKGEGAGAVTPMAPHMAKTQRASSGARVSFDLSELREILNLYGRKVAEGEWRDYAMDFNLERAVFAVYRRAAENPIYRIEKEPALARKQGAFSVVSAHGLVLRRGQELKRVLAVLEKKPKLVAW